MTEYLRNYFKTDEDYNMFISSIKEQLELATFLGKLKIESRNPLYKGGSAIIKIDNDSYYVRISKMGNITLDQTP